MKYQIKLINDKIYQLSEIEKHVSGEEKEKIKQTILELKKLLLVIKTKQNVDYFKPSLLNDYEQELLLRILNVFKDAKLIESDYYPTLNNIHLDDKSELNIVENSFSKLGLNNDLHYLTTTADISFIKKRFYNSNLDSQIFQNYYENKNYYAVAKTNQISDIYDLNYLISQGYKYENNDQLHTFDDNKIFAEAMNCYLNKSINNNPDNKKSNKLLRENFKYQTKKNDNIVFAAQKISNTLKHYNFSDINLTPDVNYIYNFLNNIMGRTLYRKSLNQPSLIVDEIYDCDSINYTDKMINLNIKMPEIIETCEKIKSKQKENEHVMRKVLNK